MSPQDKKVQAEEAEVEMATVPAPAAAPAPAPAAAASVEPAFTLPPEAAALQEPLGKSLAEITQSFANNQGYPAADATASIKGDIIINTNDGMKTVRDLIP